MKKIILSLAFIAGMASTLSAQHSSIGLRLSYPTEISYQTGLGNANRLELGLGYSNYGLGFNSSYNLFSLSGVYQWVWDLSSIGNGFYWYAGPGVAVGYYSYSYYFGSDSAFPVSLLGQVGLEYNFNIPLRLSLDYRPAFQFTGRGNGLIGNGIALGVRYKF